MSGGVREWESGGVREWGTAGKAKAARRPPCGLCGDAILHGYVCVFLHQVNSRWMIHSRAFACNYTKKLLRLKDTFYQFFYQFFGARHRDFRGCATRDCSPVRFVVRDKAARAADVPRVRGRAKRLSQFNSKFNKLV